MTYLITYLTHDGKTRAWRCRTSYELNTARTIIRRCGGKVVNVTHG